MDCTWVWVWKLKFKYQTQSTAALPDQTIKTALTEEFMFQNVAYRPTVYKTGLVMQKDHVKYLRMNIWPSPVYLSLGIIQNFSKNRKKVKKKSHQIFPKLKFYYITHMQGLQKC